MPTIHLSNEVMEALKKEKNEYQKKKVIFNMTPSEFVDKLIEFWRGA